MRVVHFHGAFKSKADAERRASGIAKARVMLRKIRRQMRFVVVTEKRH